MGLASRRGGRRGRVPLGIRGPRGSRAPLGGGVGRGAEGGRGRGGGCAEALNDGGRVKARVQRIPVGDRGGPFDELGLALLEVFRDERLGDDRSDLDEVLHLETRRVASAGVPIRSRSTPPAAGSNGTAFRFTGSPPRDRNRSAAGSHRARTRAGSHRTRCTSVPPVKTLTPPPAPNNSSRPPARPRPSAPAVPGEASEAAIFSATALPARRVQRRPLLPGNTADSIRFANSSLDKDHPTPVNTDRLMNLRRYHIRYGTGFRCNPAATRPAKCAISTTR